MGKKNLQELTGAFYKELRNIERSVKYTKAEYVKPDGSIEYHARGVDADSRICTCMADDMMVHGPVMHGADMADIAMAFRGCHYDIMRIHDDCEGHRPLMKWDNERAFSLMKEIAKVRDGGPDGGAVYPQGAYDSWIMEIWHMCILAFYYEHMDMARSDVMELMHDEYDSDGVKTYGLDEAGKESASTLLQLRTRLLKLLARINYPDDSHDWVMDKLEMLELMCSALQEDASDVHGAV